MAVALRSFEAGLAGLDRYGCERGNKIVVYASLVDVTGIKPTAEVVGRKN